jgi:hypothetical protein
MLPRVVITRVGIQQSRYYLNQIITINYDKLYKYIDISGHYIPFFDRAYLSIREIKDLDLTLISGDDASTSIKKLELAKYFDKGGKIYRYPGHAALGDVSRYIIAYLSFPYFITPVYVIASMAHNWEESTMTNKYYGLLKNKEENDY